jgi:hypothetical protein
MEVEFWVHSSASQRKWVFLATLTRFHILKTPDQNFMALRGTPWQSYTKLSDGILALGVTDE